MNQYVGTVPSTFELLWLNLFLVGLVTPSSGNELFMKLLETFRIARWKSFFFQGLFVFISPSRARSFQQESSLEDVLNGHNLYKSHHT